MSKVLTKKILSKINDYFSSNFSERIITKPERRCLKEMSVGIIKSKSVFVNQIASSLRENIKLKDLTKRLSAQYLKNDFSDKIHHYHLSKVSSSVSDDSFIIMDGSDISKDFAKCMEGLELVRDGNTGEIGLGYNTLNIVSINQHQEITPLVAKVYSYEMGTLSSNNEIKKSINLVREHLNNKGCWIYDRGADNEILKDFLFETCSKCIIRLKKNTKVKYKDEELKVSELGKRIEFTDKQTVKKVKKNKIVKRQYGVNAVPVSISIKGKQTNLWLVITKNLKHGGLCYLLVKSNKIKDIEVARWAFKGYGYRWKIEEYHRHVKQEYNLESIQMRTFNGLKSVLAILMIACYFIYRKLTSLHFEILLDSGYNYLNKHNVNELTNFIYYKISKIVSNLLIHVKLRWKIDKTEIIDNQISLDFSQT